MAEARIGRSAWRKSRNAAETKAVEAALVAVPLRSARQSAVAEAAIALVRAAGWKMHGVVSSPQPASAMG